jgi:hypothetical protein
MLRRLEADSQEGAIGMCAAAARGADSGPRIGLFVARVVFSMVLSIGAFALLDAQAQPRRYCVAKQAGNPFKFVAPSR